MLALTPWHHIYGGLAGLAIISALVVFRLPTEHGWTIAVSFIGLGQTAIGVMDVCWRTGYEGSEFLAILLGLLTLGLFVSNCYWLWRHRQ